ncbi:MAG: LuxR C-terminal-related transcriptional regulator [Agathobacter sp.]
MKKHRMILLLILYILILTFTIVMEQISIMNLGLRLLVNTSTLIMALVSGFLFWVILHNRTEEKSEQRAHRKEKISEDSRKHGIICEETKGVPDKQRFLAFAAMHELTRRETEIGFLLLNNYTNLQISEELFIAETTVKKHLTHIYEKTGTDGRKEFKECVRDALRDEESI